MTLLTRLHALVIRLYPAGFRDEFGQEMTTVFAESVAAAKLQGYEALLALCWRELADLPAALWQQHRRQLAKLRRQEMNEVSAVYSEHADRGKPALPVSRTEVLAGIFPFILFGLMYTLKGLDYHNDVHSRLWLARYWGLMVDVVLVIGLGVGWWLSFPRWSYSYLGASLVSAFWQSQTSTSGLRLLGYTFGREHWGWRAWILLLVMALVMLLLTRSLRPLAKLARDVWHDWTLLSFGLYAAVMWTQLGVAYDDKGWYEQTLYLPLNLMLLTCLIAGAAYLFMRSRRLWQRMLALEGSIILSFLLSALIVALDGRVAWGWPGNPSWWWVIFLPWLTILYFPGVLDLIRKAVQSKSAG